MRWLGVLLLAGCGSDVICGGNSDPERTMNAFWSELDSRYAMFDLRYDLDLHGSWFDAGVGRCGLVSACTDDATLLTAMLELAQLTDDGQIRIVKGELTGDAWATGYPHTLDMHGLLENVRTRYVSNTLREDFRGTNAWGRIGPVGYWHVRTIRGLSITATETADLEESRELVPRILDDLANTDAMIIDLRDTSGGWHRVGLELASFFAGSEQVVWERAERNGPDHTDFTEYTAFSVEPTEDPWSKPVVVLTSGLTYEAAETFALAMSTRPNVTVLGERTSGHFSDRTEDTLPGDWGFTFASTRYRDPDGTVYEKIGFPPDVELAFDAAAFDDGTDTMLEAAIQQLIPD